MCSRFRKDDGADVIIPVDPDALGKHSDVGQK